MKAILMAAAFGAILIAPAVAQQAPQSRLGWASRVHVYAADYYAQNNSNGNRNPDFQLGGRDR